jgi:hypothetical protein
MDQTVGPAGCVWSRASSLSGVATRVGRNGADQFRQMHSTCHSAAIDGSAVSNAY